MLAETEGKAVKIPHTPAGTVPGTQHIFAQSAADIRAEVEAAGYGIQADPAGTNPQEAVKLRIEAVTVETGIKAAGYAVQPPSTAQDGAKTGTQPKAQITLGKSGGGIVPIIQTDSYTIKYTMCGTEITKSSR